MNYKTSFILKTLIGFLIGIFLLVGMVKLSNKYLNSEHYKELKELWYTPSLVLPLTEHKIIDRYCEQQGMRYDDKCLLIAIRMAENGRSHIAWGILSSECNTYEKQMRWCYQSILNNRDRFEYEDKEIDKNFISKMGDRYCPIGCDTDNGTNKNWKYNVNYWFRRVYNKKGNKA